MMAKEIHDRFLSWNEGRGKKPAIITHFFFVQVNFLTGEQLNVGLLIINNWIDELN